MCFATTGPPSPPRNLRRSVVGVLGRNREYRIFWSASNDTGGTAVNYTVKLCVNDSIATHNNVCRCSSNSDCRPAGILNTNEDFFCILKKSDFGPNCGEFCNYTICVIASNDFGSTSTCISAPYVDRNLGKEFISHYIIIIITIINFI